jgi:DNA-binding MarR family transcriptional regulator/GNAT superfamily N-acetyltransferase
MVAFGNLPAENPVMSSTATPDAPARERIACVRAFNRLYTRRVGALDEHLLASGFTLPQSRLLWELAHRDGGVTAAELARELALDPGYLSRLLRGLRERGLVRTRRASGDARRVLLSLSAAGQRAFAPLDRRSQADAAALLHALPEPEQQRLVGAMATLGRLLAPEAAPASVRLRPPAPGDIGWLVARHGQLYAEEYGWDMRFEALVARIAADLVERFDPAREACWVAEQGGRNVGCVALVKWRDEKSGAVEPGTAQLRLLLVEPSARGQGLGQRLVDECTRFAKEHGYRRIRLWTNSLLVSARRLYEAAGYRKTASAPHQSFGHRLVGETWELAL